MPLTDEQRRKLRDMAALELGRLVMSGAYTLTERVEPSSPQSVDIPDQDNVDGLVTAAIQIAKTRTAWLRELRAALEANDMKRLRFNAELLTGLREEPRQ